MAGPQFSEAFSEHVLPLLEARCIEDAPLIISGGFTFSEVFSDILTFANERGALHLPESIFDDLVDWLATQLADAASAVMEADISDEAEAVDDPGSWVWDYP